MSEPKENQASLKKAVEADVLVAQDGKIVYIGSEAQGKIENANKVIDAIGKWLLPGFVSAHSHLRQHGLAARAPNSDVAEWSTVVANAVRLSKPANMYVITFKGRSEPAQFEAALDASIRFVHGFNIGQVTNIWPENGALARTATFQGRSLAKHAPDHFLGSKMVLQGLEYEDKRTIATEACIKKRFNLEGHIGYLESPGPKKSPLAMQSHFLHICTASEIAEEAAKAGMRMIWNLLVNGRLGSGVFDLPKDIPIGLGTDGEAACGRCDSFENMRMVCTASNKAKSPLAPWILMRSTACTLREQLKCSTLRAGVAVSRKANWPT
ncbi:amidohydrolase [Penicillium atrosanguineum]|uniref:Amidohydrolase n=1 Tax=Penicillium atrosanguineum TaxID=1132637 RepID=A0A9W9U520_9EURO|nr:amidohydrolase [Penicillium atrosanguineum]